MAVVVFIDSQANAAGGGDVTPSAINWTDLSVTSGSGIETTIEQTIAGINSPITVRAAWTSTSSTPCYGRWLKNGVAVQSPQASPVEVTAISGDKLQWSSYAANSHPSGNYDTGTVTVTNQSDSGASLDTFTYACQYVRTGGPGGGSGGYAEPPNIN